MSLCSHQSRRLSYGCRKPQAQRVQPQPIGPAQGNSPRSHPCKGYRNKRDRDLGPGCTPNWDPPVPKRIRGIRPGTRLCPEDIGIRDTDLGPAYAQRI